MSHDDDLSVIVETGTDDTRQARFGFGKGGVPLPLLLFYLSFLVFFVWYTLEYQLPDYLESGPVKPATGVESPGQ